MRARLLIEAEVSTLVIHLEDPTTDFLKAIYAGKGYPVVSGATTEKELASQIKEHTRVFMLGHGAPSGLFGRGLFIGNQFGPILAEKQDGLYIWCNADAYAVRNKLSGLVSGMFISEVSEARMFGIDASQAEVDASNAAFARIVREIMDKGEAHASVRSCYAASNTSCLITKFNSDRLYVFDHGVPTPALHPTSYGIEQPARTYHGADTKNEPLSAKEIEWLTNYLAKAIQAILDGEANFEDAINGIYEVLDTYLPDSDVEAFGEDLWYALENHEDIDSRTWAETAIANLTSVVDYP